MGGVGADLEKGVDPGTLDPREKLIVNKLHEICGFAVLLNINLIWHNT